MTFSNKYLFKIILIIIFVIINIIGVIAVIVTVTHTIGELNKKIKTGKTNEQSQVNYIENQNINNKNKEENNLTLLPNMNYIKVLRAVIDNNNSKLISAFRIWCIGFFKVFI